MTSQESDAPACSQAVAVSSHAACAVKIKFPSYPPSVLTCLQTRAAWQGVQYCPYRDCYYTRAGGVRLLPLRMGIAFAVVRRADTVQMHCHAARCIDTRRLAPTCSLGGGFCSGAKRAHEVAQHVETC